jgi:hypothetical protein
VSRGSVDIVGDREEAELRVDVPVDVRLTHEGDEDLMVVVWGRVHAG